jgi:thiol-disulfide isomerase/thioredoxin
MNKKSQNIIWWVAGGLILAGIIGLSTYKKNQPGEFDTFASCIKDSGATFYGAFWCPHCQTQKAMFGKSAKLLPYVECSTPSKSQTAACNEAGIESYPTWKFSDGSVVTGQQSFQQLADKTKCEITK